MPIFFKIENQRFINPFQSISIYYNITSNSYQHLNGFGLIFLFLTVRRNAPSGNDILIHSKGFNYGIIYPSSCPQPIFNPRRCCCSFRSGKKSQDGRMTALALTDHGNMFGIKEFHETCKKFDIKPILGVETYVASRGIHFKDKSEKEDRSGTTWFYWPRMRKATVIYWN